MGDLPQVYEVSEVVWRVVGVAGAARHRLVERALTQERRTVGRHVAEVIGQHEHLHHRLVGVEQRLLWYSTVKLVIDNSHYCAQPVTI